ncbi:MAG: hypothetical protein ACRDO7_10775 [Nocardioidaceae bacterium]
MTMRHGKLVRSKAPGQKTRAWSLTSPDGTRSGDAGGPPGLFSHKRGYYRDNARGRVRIVRKDVRCGGVVGCLTERVTFVWRKGHWDKVASRQGSLGMKGGWHVKGLDVW